MKEFLFHEVNVGTPFFSVGGVCHRTRFYIILNIHKVNKPSNTFCVVLIFIETSTIPLKVPSTYF